MEMTDQTDQNHCDACGGLLQSGPLGPQCMHCLLSLGTADEAFADVAELFPELKIQGAIAHGGFGSVFHAEQRRMKRPVALKFLDTGLRHTPEAVALFEQEMVTVASLSHPGIVQAFDAGDREGQCYIVMELVDGEDCGALARLHKRLPIAESCEIIRQAALGLDYAHEKGLVHRDVKPGNLIVSRHSPSVKVLDFGLACIAVTPVFGDPEAVSDHDDDHRFLGTLEYIAPEQIEAPDHVDARADIYALGATLRRLLTGQPAREGMSEQSLILQMKVVTSISIAPIAALRPDLPGELADLCDRLIALDPDDRPGSAAEVAELIEPWCAGAELERLFTDGPLPEKPFVYPKKNRRPLWIAAAVAVIIALGVLFFDAEKPDAPPAALPGSPVFSEAVAQLNRLDRDHLARLLSMDWKVEREVFSSSPASFSIKSARLRPDGRLIFINDKNSIFREKRPGGEHVNAHSRGVVEGCETMGVHPDTGDFVWSRRGHPDDLAILRHRADGTALTIIGPDFSRQASEEARAAMRAKRSANGDNGAYANARGFAFVTEGNLPPDTDLQAGDVLYADEGYVGLALYDRPIAPRLTTRPGLWKFRFDTDEPAQQISDLSKLWIPGGTNNYPIDVTVSRHGIFLLSRNQVNDGGQEITGKDYNRRVLRREGNSFRPCQTDQPISRPAGIAADPLTADLYVLDGGTDVAPGVAEQRVLRLRPDGPDSYKVEVFASGFLTLSYYGIQFTADGQRMVITDERLAAAVVLKRTVQPPTPPVVSPAPISVDEDSTYRLIGANWETESETHFGNHSVEGARFTPEGDIACRILAENGGIWVKVHEPVTGNVRPVDIPVPDASYYFGVAPDTGHFIWDQRNAPNYYLLGRCDPLADLLPSLQFDPSGDFDGTKREEMRKYRHRYVEEDQERRPIGFAFVTAGQIPKNTDLKVGDVLIADEGHRWLAPLKPLKPKDKHGLGALWRCRFDSDQAAERLGEDEQKIDFPLDVAVARSGVFLLNRDNFTPLEEDRANDRTRRLLRWDNDGFHACTLSQPIHDPSGLAADPTSTDLYVIEGAGLPTANLKLQRLLRLRLTAQDQYDVEVIAHSFGKLRFCGVGISQDGQRLIVTDTGNRVVIVLKRKG
jgi:serine/threonine protein kinase